MEQIKCQNCATLNDKYATKCQSCGMPLSTHRKTIENKKLSPETKALILVVSPFIITLLGVFGLFDGLPQEIIVLFLSTFNIMIFLGFTMSFLQRNARNMFMSLIAFAWIILINVGVFYQFV